MNGSTETILFDPEHLLKRCHVADYQASSVCNQLLFRLLNGKILRNT